MDTIIAWCGFLGAWLLVAGPVYQATIELQEQDIERDQIQAATDAVQAPSPVSAWWWLLPPVKYWLERQRSREYRRRAMAALPAEQLTALIRYINKATGWVLVGSGGAFLALKETWELHDFYAWPVAAFWVLVVVAAAVSVGYAAIRLERSRQVLRGNEARADQHDPV